MKTVNIGEYKIGNGSPVVLIAGPCVIESREHALRMAGEIKNIADKLDIPYIFKSSYDKANRTSIHSYRGPGLKDGLEILAEIKEKFDLPVLSDVHTPDQAKKAAHVLDILQIPAFLCRQTDLVVGVAEAGKPVNVKKGQFLAPWDIAQVIKKIESANNHQILVTERGASFGYNYLVSDMRSLVIMRELGYPVVFDATHSVQMPGGKGTSSGGDRDYVPHLTRAASAVGIDALFVEVHDDPDNALSDGPNMLRLEDLSSVLENVKAIDKLVKR
jgi:2-dehydro-3-deoxyphosphooctonate aldolase (KDO 8-P synthase)